MEKRLYKGKNRVFFGVCSGIAEYFNIDPTLVRVLAIIFTFIGCGGGILAYIIAAIIMPKKEDN